MWTFLGYGKTYLDKCGRDNIGAYAAQTAYFMIMSSIPFLMLLFWIASYVPSINEYINELIYEVIPDSFAPMVNKILAMIMDAPIGAISLSAIMAVWASGKAFQNLMVGLNQVNKIEETRGWLARRIRAIFYTLIILSVIVVIDCFVCVHFVVVPKKYYGFCTGFNTKDCRNSNSSTENRSFKTNESCIARSC